MFDPLTAAPTVVRSNVFMRAAQHLFDTMGITARNEMRTMCLMPHAACTVIDARQTTEGAVCGIDVIDRSEPTDVKVLIMN